MKISIKWAIFLVFTLLIVVCVGFILTTSYHTSKASLLSHSKSIMKNIITFTSNKTISHITVAQDASELTQGLAKHKLVNSEDFVGMQAYFLEQLKVHKQFFNIYYGNENGSFIMVSKNTNQDGIFYVKTISTNKADKKILFQKIDKNNKILSEKELPNDKFNPSQRPWYSQTKKELSSIWTDPYIFFDSKEPGITSASPVFSVNGNFQGSVGVDIKVSEISNLLQTLDFSNDGLIAIFDEKHNVVASNKLKLVIKKSNNLKLAKIEDLHDPILNQAFSKLLPFQNIHQKETFISINDEDQTYHVVFAPLNIGDITWIIVIYLSENSYLGDIKDTQQKNIYIAICFGIALLFLAYNFAKKISNPIQQMQLFATEVQLHRLDTPRLPPSILKEINESSNAFHSLKKEIIEYDEQTQKLNQDLHNASLDTLYRLAIAAEYKDTDTAEHIKRISKYSKILAKELGLSETQIYIIEHASIMHDVGKIGIADKILLKPGKLDTNEMRIMKTHSDIGGKILDNPSSEIMIAAREIALYHHEKFDGTGYPEGLRDEQIPIMARIVAVVDVFDALVSKRCYKEAFSFEKALSIILEGKGKHFDPACVAAFEKNLEKIKEIYKKHSDTNSDI